MTDTPPPAPLADSPPTDAAIVATDETSEASVAATRGPRVFRFLLASPFASAFVAALGVILAVAIALAVGSLGSVLLTIFVSLFLALGLDPTVAWMQRKGIKRSMGILIVALAVVAIAAVIVLVLLPALISQFIHAVQAAPEYIAKIEASDWARDLQTNWGIDIQAAIAEVTESLVSLSSFVAIGGGILHVAGGIVSAISSGFMIIVLTLYFVASLPMIKEAMGGLVPMYRRRTFLEVLNQITASVGGAVGGAITLSTINAAVVFVLQLVVGSSVPMVMAIGAFFITLVPMVGSLIFLVIGTVCSLFISPLAALIFFVGYFAYVQLEAYYVTPRVLGKAVAVPGVLVLIAAMVGAALMGLLGALVAIPITASILIVIRQVVVPRRNAQVHAPSDG